MPGRHITAIVVLVRGDGEVARWPLEWHGRLDLSAIDDLARLQLAAKRLGCSIRLRDACVELVELLAFAGLGVEVGGQSEGGEQGGVEEVVVPDDPVA